MIKGRSGAGRTGFLPQSSSLHGLSGGGRDSPTRTKGHKPLVLQKLPPLNSGQANGVQINHVRISKLPCKGSFINNVDRNLDFFDPLPLCYHFTK